MLVQENAAVSVVPLERPSSIGEDPRWSLVERILASPDFLRSPRLSEFLRFASKESLEGRGEDLNEQRIGEVVFGRSQGYDSSADSIVRSHALRLRQRLEQYFEQAGSSEAVRLVMPRGSYAVVFEAVPAVPVDASSSFAETSPTLPLGESEYRFNESVPTSGEADGHPLAAESIRFPRGNGQERAIFSYRPKTLIALCILLGACTLISVSMLLLILHSQKSVTIARSPLHPLWSVMFSSQRPTTFVAADSALALLHGQMKKETTLDDYLAHNFREQLGHVTPARAAEILDLGRHRYTSYVDLEALHRFESVPQARQNGFAVKYARDLHISDLKNGNVIISGSSDANPWVELFEPEMNFVMRRDFQGSQSVVLNRHPRAGEEPTYVISSSDSGPKDKVYGLIAFLPNLDGAGHAMILEGSSLAGTEAVSDFLFDDSAFLPFLSQIKRPDGSIPHFEALLESDIHAGNAGRFHVVTYRIER